MYLKRIHIKLGILLTLFFVPLLMAASCGETKPPSPIPNPDDKTPPTVVSLTPTDGSAKVALTEPISVVFSEAVKVDTVTNSSVTLSGKGGLVLDKTLTLSSDGKTLSIAYKNLTTNPGTVTISLVNTITDLAGNKLAATSWSYSTPLWLDLGDVLDVDKKNFTFEPAIVTDKDGKIVVAWYEQDASSQTRVYVKRWTGTAWEQLGDVLNTVADSNANDPSLAIDSQNRPVVAWHESDTTSSTVKVKMWTGTTWEQLGGGHGGTTLTVDDGEFPSLALASDGAPVLAYEKSGDVLVRVWDSSTLTWVQLGGELDGLKTHLAGRPSLAIDLGDSSAPTPDIIYVAFQENDDAIMNPSSNIFVKYYDDFAGAWIKLGDYLDKTVTNESQHPSLSIDQSKVLVAWEENQDINVKSYALGAMSTWQDVGQDDYKAQDSGEPFILSARGVPLVTWRGNDGSGQNVYIKSFDAESNAWTTPSNPLGPINTPGIGSENPVVTLDGNLLPVAAFAEFDDVSKSQNLHVKRLNFPLVP
jgi:hypothetical protein